MALTTVEVIAYDGATEITLVPRGGTGTPAVSYVPTPLAGQIKTIDVPEGLEGRWTAVDSFGATTDLELVDEAKTIRLAHPFDIIDHGGPGPWTGSSVGVYTVSFIVEDDQQNRISGARIGIQGTTFSTVTGVDGEASLNVDSGTYTFTIIPPPGYSGGDPVTMLIEADETITFALVNSGGSGPELFPAATINGQEIPYQDNLTRWQADDYISGARVRAYRIDVGDLDLTGATGAFKAVAIEDGVDDLIETPCGVAPDPDADPESPRWLFYYSLTRQQLNVTPGEYRYDAEIYLPEGDVITVVYGRFNVEETITDVVP